MMCNLLGTVWLLCCTLSLGVVQAARTMQTRTRPRDSFIQVGSLLKFATWNCGGLSFMQREMCRDLDYDLLALTETHDKGTLQRKKDFVCSDIAPQNDPFSGVVLLLSNHLSTCVLHNGSNSSRVVFAIIRADSCGSMQPIHHWCVYATRSAQATTVLLGHSQHVRRSSATGEK